MLNTVRVMLRQKKVQLWERHQRKNGKNKNTCMNRSQKTPLNCLKWIKIDKQLLSTIARFQLNSCSYKLSDRIEIEITRNMKNLTNKQNLSNIIMTEKKSHVERRIKRWKMWRWKRIAYSAQNRNCEDFKWNEIIVSCFNFNFALRRFYLNVCVTSRDLSRI